MQILGYPNIDYKYNLAHKFDMMVSPTDSLSVGNSIEVLNDLILTPTGATNGVNIRDLTADNFRGNRKKCMKIPLKH